MFEIRAKLRRVSIVRMGAWHESAVWMSRLQCLCLQALERMEEERLQPSQEDVNCLQFLMIWGNSKQKQQIEGSHPLYFLLFTLRIPITRDRRKNVFMPFLQPNDVTHLGQFQGFIHRLHLQSEFFPCLCFCVEVIFIFLYFSADTNYSQIRVISIIQQSFKLCLPVSGQQ